MLQAYIDGSGTGDDRFLVLAGYISTADKWAAFATEWQRLLDMRSAHYRHLSYFKMKEIRTSKREMERCIWFYRIIEKYATAAVSCVIDVAGLRRAVRKSPWLLWTGNVGILENPYYFAFHAIINMLAQHQHRLGISEPIDFIFDNETEKGRCIAAWDEIKRDSTSEVQALMGDTPIYRDDKTTNPLQAADLYAYWVREWELVGDFEGLAKLKFPWVVERDIPRIDFKFGERDFLSEFNRGWSPKGQGHIHPATLSTALRNTLWSASGWTGKLS
jgi:Protein of unknown function (DUF3800)